MPKQAKKKSGVKKNQYKNILIILKKELGRIQIRRIFKVAAAGFIFEFILFVSYFSYLDFKAGIVTNQAIKQAAAFSAPAADAFSAMALKDPYVKQDRISLKPEKGDGGPQEAEIVPGEVIVKFKTTQKADEAVSGRKTAKGTIDMASAPDLKNRLEKHKISKAEKISKKKNKKDKSDDRDKIVKLKSDDSTKEETKKTIEDLKNDPNVEYAEPNYIMKTQMIPNDPYYATTGAWGQDFRDLWGLQNIQAESAWDTTQGEGVVVAVSDTGVDYNHEDIAENIWTNAGEVGVDVQGKDKKSNGIDDDNNGYIDDWRGWDFTVCKSWHSFGCDKLGSPDNDPMDGHKHGTHVAGTIAAIGGNNLGIIGVSPKVKIMPVKGLSDSGGGMTDELVNTIYYAADNGAQIINCSWGGYGRTSKTLIDAINYAHDVKGVIIVTAAGNSNYDVGVESYGFYPANIRNVVTVAAHDHTDTKAYFSNFGKKIDVSAPGGGETDTVGDTINNPIYSILSLKNKASAINYLSVGAKYIRLAGTSMASPHVAGVAALVKAAHPEFSPEQIRQAIRRGSVDINAAGFDIVSGSGKVNAQGAVGQSNMLGVRINSPKYNEKITGFPNIEIRGEAQGNTLVDWTLEYGEGESPAIWTTLKQSANQASSNSILSTWNIANISDGVYTLHLLARNSLNEIFEDAIVITIDQIAITSPLPSNETFYPNASKISFFKSGAITVRGTAAPKNITKFEIVLKKIDNSIQMVPVSLINNGLSSVYNNELGSIDITNVPNGRYDIVLLVTLTDGSIESDFSKIVIDHDLHSGWPINIRPERTAAEGRLGGLSIYDHLNSVDVDRDGDKEIIIAYRDSITIYDHTGAVLPGWPQKVASSVLFAHALSGPVVDDITGDDYPEIIIRAEDKIYAWQWNGTLLPGWPKEFKNINTLVVDDINNDGINEIIMGGYESGVSSSLLSPYNYKGKINIVNKYGISLPGWPASVELINQTHNNMSDINSFSIGDIDHDGKKEILISYTAMPDLTLWPDFIFIFKNDGTLYPGWPQSYDPPEPGMNRDFIRLADLEHDGYLEIFVGTVGSLFGSDSRKTHAFRYNGAVVAGWPKTTPSISQIGQVNASGIDVRHSLDDEAPLVVGDINGDGDPEIIRAIVDVENGNFMNIIHAWDKNGNEFPGWPVKIDIGNLPNFGAWWIVDGFGAIAIADVDGDQKNDVIAGGDISDFNNPATLHAYRYDGLEINGFPKYTESISIDSSINPVVDDLDNDGLQELAWIDTEGNIYIWDLSAPAASGNNQWPMFQRDGKHSANALISPLLQKETIPPTVVFEKPSNNTVIGNSAILKMNASDNSYVEAIEFYKDNESAPFAVDVTSPFEVSVSNLTAGPHLFKAKAFDPAGNLSLATTSVVTDITVPEVAITFPQTNNAFVQGIVSLEASATDDNKVEKVEFYIGGQLSGTDATDPYSFSWDTSSLIPGSSYSIYAKAFDSIGNVGVSPMIAVTIADITPPTISLLSPLDKAVVSGKVAISASASDNRGVSKVEFYVDNSLVLTDYSNPFAAEWDSSAIFTGSEVIIHAKAYDFSGNTTQSSDITILIKDTKAPVISQNIKLDQYIKGINELSVTATDNIGIAKVEFYMDNTLLGSSTAAPYVFSLDTKIKTNGTHVFFAKVYDAAGNTATSKTVTSIIDNSPPAIPSNISSVLNASIQPYLLWKASSDNSAVSGYKIYRDNQLLGSVSSAVLNYTDTGVSVGQTYSYSISSVDMAGNESVKSNPVSVKVVSAPTNQNANSSPPLNQNANTNNSVSQNINSSPPLIKNSNFNANISINRNTNVSVNSNANIGSRNNTNTNQGGIANNNINLSISVNDNTNRLANNNPSVEKDITPPMVSIISPASSNKVAKKSIIVLKAAASDDIKVEKVEFYANSRLLCSDDSAEYSCDWKVSAPGNPAYDIQAKAYDAAGNASESEIVKLSLQSDSGVIVTGSGGSEPVIRILQSGGSEMRKFLAYEKQFRGGVSVKTADLNNDGTNEIIAAPGKGRESEVRIFNFYSGRIDQFLAYGKSFKGGVNIAIADFEGDGSKEIIVSPQSGAPQIRVFGKRGGKWKQITPSFLAFSSKIKTGVNIVSGDFDGDGKDEIAAAPGSGSISQVKIFGLLGNKIKEVMLQFAPFGNLFKGGINLAAGDVNGDWKDEIIASPASRGSSTVRVFDFYGNGKRRLLISPFFAFDKNLRSGANLGTGDFDGDGKSEIIASMADKGQSLVRIYSNDGKNKIQEFKGFEQQMTGGIRIEKW